MKTYILEMNVNTCRTALSNLLLQPDAVISVRDKQAIPNNNAPLPHTVSQTHKQKE
jgi:hypothetical protein